MLNDSPEEAARRRRWSVEAMHRLDKHIVGVLRGIDDPDADEAFAALVARLAAIAEQGDAR